MGVGKSSDRQQDSEDYRQYCGVELPSVMCDRLAKIPMTVGDSSFISISLAVSRVLVHAQDPHMRRLAIPSPAKVNPLPRCG